MRSENISSQKEFLRFLYIALGSLSELEAQLITSQKLGSLKDVEIFAFLEKEKSKILELIKHVKGRQNVN